MKKIKVLIVAGTMNVGGIENQLMHLLRKADKEKFQIDFTSTDDHPFYMDEMLSLGANCIKLPRTEGKRFLRYNKALYNVIKNGDYDIVHSHELFHSGMVLLTARLAGVRHRFVHAHSWMEGADPTQKKSFKRRAYNHAMQKLIQWNATDFIACSTLAAKFVFGDKVIKKDNYHLVFNSVDTSKFIDQYDAKETGDYCDDGWINVFQIGRFTSMKNQAFSAEIAREFKNNNKKIRILIAGNNGESYEKVVQNKIDEYQVNDHMILLGIRKDVDSLMRKSKAFLHTSLYEGMPLVIIEAQASGLPIVTSDTYSHEVDFGLGKIQWLNLDQPASEWADAIEKAIASGRAEKEDVYKVIEEKGFDSRIFAKKICDLYQKAVEGSSDD